jgi:hypothetical protein
MADYVEATGCGQVIDQVSPADILTAVDSLVQDYDALQETARQVGQRDFTQEAMIASYQNVYDTVSTAERVAAT